MSSRKDEFQKMCFDILNKTWREMGHDLATGKVFYTSKSVLDYTFMKQFSDFFKQEMEKHTVLLAKEQIYYRAAHGTWDYRRLVPSPKYKKENRMNPEGHLYLYLGFDPQTCFKEIRANEGDIVTYGQFNIPSPSVGKRIIDLTVAEQQTYDQLIDELVVFDGNVEKTRQVLGKIYLKMISDKLFVPIDEGMDRSLEYAPFHAFAYYFMKLGFSGIIYKSTVHPGGKNLVLFNPKAAKVVETTVSVVTL